VNAARGALLGGLAVLATAGACSKPAPRPKPVSPLGPTCVLETTLATRVEDTERSFPPQYWFSLLAQGVRSSGRVQRPARDCAGWAVKSTGGRCSDPEDGGQERPFDSLQPEHLTLAPVRGALRLAWLRTGQFGAGEGIGPVALVDLTPDAMIVKATGTLRLPDSTPKLRLETLGDTIVLVAEGDTCPNEPDRCDHGLRVLPLRRNRFVDVPFEDDKGGCVGSSLILVRSRGTVTGPKGGDYVFESSVSFGTDGLDIHEQLAVQARAAAGAPVDGFVSRVQGDRTVKLRDGRLVASGPSLLERWLGQTR
jgi:hypothetical protein